MTSQVVMIQSLQPKGCEFESTQENPSWHNWKVIDWDVMNQIKQIKVLK